MSQYIRTHKGIRRRWTLDLAIQRERCAKTSTDLPVFDKWYTIKQRDLMSKVRSNRTFNGRLYLIDDVHRTKGNAQYYAKAHRYEGRKARVIPSKHGYVLYVGLEE